MGNKTTGNPKTILWDWRSFFQSSTISQAENDSAAGKLIDFDLSADQTRAVGRTQNGFYVFAKKLPTSYHEAVASPRWDRLGYYSDSEGRMLSRKDFYSCSCSMGMNGGRCRHLATLMLRLEKERGPFLFTETEEEIQERIKAAEEEKERKRREAEARLEKARLEKEKQEKERQQNSALAFLQKYAKPVPQGITFPPDAILKKAEIQTNFYEVEQAERYLQNDVPIVSQCTVVFNHQGTQSLSVNGSCSEYEVSFLLNKDAIFSMSCECGRTHARRDYFWSSKDRDGKMCCHALCVYLKAWEQIIQDNPGDETDRHAEQLLSLLVKSGSPEKAAEEVRNPQQEKDAVLVLTPRITKDKKAGLQLSFDLGKAGGKNLAVKGLENFVSAAEQEAVYSLSKTEEIDFSKYSFDEASARWYRLIVSRVRSVQSINNTLDSGYYYSTRHLSVGTGIPLQESDLDQVYDLAEGGEILYQVGGKKDVYSVKVQPCHARAQVSLSPIFADNNSLIGISLTGTMPRLLRGSLHQYLLDSECFGRVSGEELDALDPFRSIADENGVFHCTIGKNKFPEFFYRVLPALEASEQILIDNKVGSIDPDLLPPEPEFTFYIDLADVITCQTIVQYGEQSYFLGFSGPYAGSAKRDISQEERVLSAVQIFFPAMNPEDQCYFSDVTEDTLAGILTDGVALLSRYGTVKGSDAFQRVHIQAAPAPRISVEIEGGLLNLSVLTKDLSEEELLALLSSYRMKKRGHRLKSGDFVDLRHAEQLEEMDRVADDLNVSMEDLVRGGIHLPKYRSLYVEKLLDSHNEIAASRDRHFKALVRSFQTIKDSDFEVSETLSDTMRPYQIYGFRWLSTLTQAGFGGILADEMGLGKTLQMLSLLSSMKESGENRPALVVCPASLVYNWKEECSRFTPNLSAETLAGTLSQRKAMLKQIAAGQGADLYITSYDLLKRDITAYDDLSFSSVILDEAQYIKNQKTAIAKTVKVLKSDHRFALTGTPIENRLSELWSIFDFLMPGFLYTSSEFAERFETPIMKKKDAEATNRLSRMTEPFILRRKKTDVLKDLPEKLEEVHSSMMEDDQRRLYDAQVVHMKELLDSTGDSGEDKMRILAEITRLRQLCCDPSLLFEDYKGSSTKRQACLELIQNAIDGGHRMLVFSQFTSMLSLLAEDLKKEKIPFFTITGSTPKQERLRLVNEFNSNERVPVFLVSLKAGGTGLNLTGADVVIHYDPWWNLAVQNQATDRAHRIGQTRKVTVIKLIAANSIEEKIVQLQEAKRDLADAIMEGQSNSLMSMTKEELLALLS
ncbi:MAG: DEAD/DEAH box helicase [Oscillospiraceae bacterium]|nr:DEAD/DEAH box helicase [Oscillospiraceae bacterium]